MKTPISTTGNWNSGYTLIELGVVVFLIGLLVSISVPRMRDSLLFDDGKTATRRIVGEIKRLRDQAVKERKDFSIHFDLGTNSFWKEQPNMSPEERSAAREQAKSLAGDARIVDISSLYNRRENLGEPAIHFTKKGYVEPSVIHLQADADTTWTIVLSPYLSRIKVYDEYVDVSDI